MKRSKIFLGITTAVLGVAGVAAAKHYGPTKTRFYVTSGQNFCKAISSLCTSGGSTACQYTVGSGSTAHQYIVFTKGPEGSYSSSNPQNCLNQLFYTNVEP